VYAAEAERVNGEVLQSQSTNTRVMTRRQPVGVVGAITPWNFPNAMITRKCGAALAAGSVELNSCCLGCSGSALSALSFVGGANVACFSLSDVPLLSSCTVVLKPSEFTPYSAFALAELGARAGLPRGVMNLVTGDAAPIGKALTQSKVVKKFTFTGSTRVGKLLLAQCADTVKRTSMELGGNAPFIVFDDADLDAALTGVMLCKFRNSGQTCVTANRIFVQAGVYDEFARRLAEKVKADLKQGSGLDKTVNLGPLINAAAVKKVAEQVADAKSKGGKVLIGGGVAAKDTLVGEVGQQGDQSLFFAPTVVTGATNEMLVAQEETFGPVAFLFKVN
jgi:succinate-semialdehyde dehydrogenase/glutarate-semialdehyde dehydrogenase